MKSRKERALERFLRESDVTLNQIACAPPLTEHLKALGSRKTLIGSMRFSSEKSIQGFLKVYDKIPSEDRESISLEAIALSAGVNINELVGAIVFSFRSLTAQKSALKTMAAHPAIVDSTIRNAKLPGGQLDRKMIHEAVGFLPTPKGSSININFPGLNQASTTVDDEPDATPPEIEEIFPLVTDKQQDWQAHRNKLLEGNR